MQSRTSVNLHSAKSHGAPAWDVLGDFTSSWRVLPISALAIVIGAVCAFVALALSSDPGAAVAPNSQEGPVLQKT